MRFTKKRASESPKIYDLCIKKARESPKFAIRAQKKAQESPKFARKKGPFFFPTFAQPGPKKFYSALGMIIYMQMRSFLSYQVWIRIFIICKLT